LYDKFISNRFHSDLIIISSCKKFFENLFSLKKSHNMVYYYYNIKLREIRSLGNYYLAITWLSSLSSHQIQPNWGDINMLSTMRSKMGSHWSLTAPPMGFLTVYLKKKNKKNKSPIILKIYKYICFKICLMYC